jgi:hypothetical protein
MPFDVVDGSPYSQIVRNGTAVSTPHSDRDLSARVPVVSDAGLCVSVCVSGSDDCNGSELL